MRFNKKFTKNYDEVKLHLKNNNINDKIIKYRVSDKYINVKFYHSRKFKKNLFIVLYDHNNTKIIRGILKD